MPAHIRTTLVIILLALGGLCLTGCAAHAGGRLYESQPWVQRGGSLGKVAVIITGEMYDPARNSDPPAKPDRVKNAIKEAFAKLPDTTVLDDIATLPGTAPMGDREAIALGRSYDAQSVCVVSIATIGGRFTIGFLPPILPAWSCETFALYSIRILDVQSGDLLVSGTTFRHDGGPYQICDWDDYLKGFQRDLAPPKTHAQAIAATSRPSAH